MEEGTKNTDSATGWALKAFPVVFYPGHYTRVDKNNHSSFQPSRDLKGWRLVPQQPDSRAPFRGGGDQRGRASKCLVPKGSQGAVA